MMRTMLTIFFTALSASAFGAEGVPGGGWGDVLRMMTGLGIVLGLLLLLYALARKGVGGLSGGRTGLIKIVETRHLGAKKALCVVEVGGEQLLLGIGAERIDLLCRLEKGGASGFEQSLQARMEEKR